MLGVSKEWIPNIWHRINIYWINTMNEQINKQRPMCWLPVPLERKSVSWFCGHENVLILYFPQTVFILLNHQFYPELTSNFLRSIQREKNCIPYKFQGIYFRVWHNFKAGFSKIVFNNSNMNFTFDLANEHTLQSPFSAQNHTNNWNTGF